MSSRFSISIIARGASQCQFRTRTRTTTRITTATRRCMSTFKPSLCLNEKITMKVPTMGDSITEGTIVEWAAEVGQAVKEGDVVALVETDKVTIDIKAEVDGIISEHYGELEETVEVGANLYQIDTDGTATATVASNDDELESTEAAASTSTPTAEETVADVAATDGNTSTSKTRTPSIQFLGKDGWKKKLSIVGESTTPTPTTPMKPNASTIVGGGKLTPMYGRLPFSEREIEALILGGASEAPSM